VKKPLLERNVQVQSINSTPIEVTLTFKALKNRLLFYVFLLLFPLVACADPTQPQSLATATADTTQAITNQFTTLTSTHFVFIFNNNSFVNPYVYTFSLCAKDQTCTTKIQVIYLQPHEGVNINWSLTNDVLYTTAATYPIIATSSITGSDVNIIATGNSVINVIQPFQVIQTRASA
jgi:hypothetical protein